jgi:hypothetical protein
MIQQNCTLVPFYTIQEMHSTVPPILPPHMNASVRQIPDETF